MGVSIRIQVRGSTARVTSEVDGEVVIDRLFDGVEARLGDFSPAWPGVLAAYREIVNRAFATEGASTDAGAWQPLAPRTMRERATRGFPPEHPILQRTGTLRRAVTLESPDNVVAALPGSLTVAITDPRFAYHQSKAPRVKLPRRAMISFTMDDRYALIKPLTLYVRGIGQGPAAA